jgi:hypothetical protein
MIVAGDSLSLFATRLDIHEFSVRHGVLFLVTDEKEVDCIQLMAIGNL